MDNRRSEDRRLSDEVSHGVIYGKLVEHDEAIANMGVSFKNIDGKLDPIVTGINSIAFAFKVLLWMGAGSAAVAGMIELANRLGWIE